MPRVSIRCSQTVKYRRDGEMSDEELDRIADAMTGSCRHYLQPGDVGCDERRDLVDGEALEPDDIEIIVDGKCLGIEDLERIAAAAREKEEA